MPRLCSYANGNWNGATTFKVLDTTFYADAETSVTAAASGATIDSAGVIPGAITVDGIGLKFSHTTSATPTGTITVILRNSTDGVNVASVTVNTTDIFGSADAPTSSAPLGWFVFSFASVTLIAGKTYIARITMGAGNTVNVLRGGGSADWCRFLRTTTTATVADGDTVNVAGELTGAGTQNAYTITMNQELTVTTVAPTTFSNDASGGTTAWSNPTNASADDGSYATVPFTSAVNSQRLKGVGGFAIPATDVVIGIVVELQRKADVANRIFDQNMVLLKAGTATGNDYGATNAYWETTDTVVTYGRWNDMWGTTWTAAEVNNANFGFYLTCTNSSGTVTASIDYVKITVYSIAKSVAGLTINRYSTLAYDTTASKNYGLAITPTTMGGSTRAVEVSGTLSIGTSGTRVPKSSNAILYIKNAVSVDSGLEVRKFGTLQTAGYNKTPWTRLTADVSTAVGQTMAVNAIADWDQHDILGIAGTARSLVFQRGYLYASASSTSIQITKILGVDRSGGNNAQGDAVGAHIINLSRNVCIRGQSITLTGYVNFSLGALTSYLLDTEFFFLGSNAAGKYGVTVRNNTLTTVNFTVNYCAFHDYLANTCYTIRLDASTSGTWTVSYNSVLGNTQQVGLAITTAISSSPAPVFDNNVIIGAASGVPSSDNGITLTNNVAANINGSGFTLNELNGVVGTVTGNIAYGCSTGFTFTRVLGNIGANTAYRNTAGVNVSPGNLGSTILTSWKAFGNTTNLLGTNTAGFSGQSVIIVSATVYGEGSFASTAGASFSFAGPEWDLYNCTFASCTSDISIGALAGGQQVIAWNSTIATVTFASTLAGEILGVSSWQTNGTVGNHLSWKGNGRLARDAVIFNTQTISHRLTPSTAASKLTSLDPNGWTGKLLAAVLSTQTCVFEVETRKSVIGDGAAYNGNQPRLMLRAHYAAGYSVDQVLATHSAAAGTWETLTSAAIAVSQDCVLEAYVDCDGTAGWVNWSPIAITVS